MQGNDDATKSRSMKLQEVFGESFSSPNVLPLSYQTSAPPDDHCHCDMPGCQFYNRENLDWKIILGCWHSFHTICLNGLNYCPICKTHLAKEVRRLGQKAKDGIFGGEAPLNYQNAEVSDNENEDDDINEIQVNDGFDPAQLVKLHSVTPVVPGTSKSTLVVSVSNNQMQNKPPHCRKCSHVSKGHKRPPNQPVQCPSCPNQNCSENGHQINCSCQWHQPVAPVVEPLLVSIENDIKILSFPENQSQATLSPTQTSNACVIISLLVCSEVYGNQVPELSVQNIREIQDFYILKMRQGNDLYEMNQHHIPQPNLDVQEALDMIPMPVEIGPGGFIGIMDIASFKREVKPLFDGKDKMCAVVMTPPDKSYAICKINDKLGLFESHHHYERGAVIAFTVKQNIDAFCNYINEMTVNDWSKSLQFSNLTPIIAQED